MTAHNRGAWNLANFALALAAALGSIPAKPEALLDRVLRRSSEPLAPERAFSASARRMGRDRVAIDFSFAENYYMYRDQIRVDVDAPDGARFEGLDLPPAVLKDDATYGRTPVYARPFTVEASLSGAHGRRVVVIATFQGCFVPRGICYPPQQARFSLPAPP